MTDTLIHNAPVRTQDHARACLRDAFTGMLRVGVSADVIMLNRDILACPATAISATRVRLTLFKGTGLARLNPWGDCR